METANAFDVLIVPMMQWLTGVFVTFPILHGVRVGLGRLFAESAQPEQGQVSR